MVFLGAVTVLGTVTVLGVQTAPRDRPAVHSHHSLKLQGPAPVTLTSKSTLCGSDCSSEIFHFLLHSCSSGGKSPQLFKNCEFWHRQAADDLSWILRQVTVQTLTPFSFSSQPEKLSVQHYSFCIQLGSVLSTQMAPHVGCCSHSTNGRLKLGSLDGWCGSSLPLHGGRRMEATSVDLGRLDPARGSLLLEFGRGRNAVRGRRRGAAQPVIVGCCSFPPDALFLGFDSSTQSLKATAIDSELRLCKTAKVHYDSDLPHYGTKDGVHRDPHVKGRYTAPVLMLVEALDMILTQLAMDGFPFHKVYAISGSAQQHGSVYWTQGACNSLLKNLDPSKSLLSQLQNAFATQDCPMWMDSTTSAQCSAIEEGLGGAASVTALTGSRSLERYTGPQIRKIYETEEGIYHATERVSLISSFMASLLVGDYVAIDHSDAAGMTLMDLHHRTWSPDALNATAPGLEDKLGPLAVPHSMAGKLHPYYVDRYNFSPSCQIVHWSGDNPCSLAGLTMTHPGDIAISLGTGDTVFGVTYDSHPGLDGHVFPNPIDPKTYVAMLVHKNGSLSREEVRNRYANGSWEAFNELLDKTPPLNEGRMGFYYKEWESLPPLPVGYHRYVLERSTSNSYTVQDAKKVPDFDAAAEVRAIVEGQFLSMRAHAERIGLPCPPERVIATGGGSTNKHLLALMATIFGCDVYTANCPDSAPLGAALRAAHGWMCHEEDAFVPLASILERANKENAFQCSLLAKKGSRELHDKYGQLAKVRMEIEQQLLEEINPWQAEVRVERYQDLLEETYPHHEAIASGLDRVTLDF